MSCYLCLKKQDFEFLRRCSQSFSEMFPSCSQEIFLNRKSSYYCCMWHLLSVTHLLRGKRCAGHCHVVAVVSDLGKTCMEKAYTPKQKGVIKIKSFINLSALISIRL